MLKRDSLFIKHLILRRGPALAATAILLAQALVTVALPMPMRFIMNHLLAPGHGAPHQAWLCLIPHSWPKPWLLTAAVSWLALLCGLNAALEVAQDYWLGRAVNSIIEGVRRDLLDLLLSRRAGFVEAQQKAEVVGRVSADASNLESILSLGLPTFLRALPTLVMILAVLWTINRSYALAMLAMVLVMYLLNSRLSSRMRAFSKEGRRETNRFEHEVYQTLAAFPLIKSLSLEKASLGLMSATARRITEVNVRTQVAESVMGASLSVAKQATRVLLLALGGAAVLKGTLSVGDLILFLSYVDMVSAPVNELSKFTVKFAKASVGHERIGELIAAAQAHAELGGPHGLAGTEPALRLSRICFAHADGPRVLEDFSAELAGGDLVAVVGPSGAGKTSFLKLLNRLADPERGEIVLCGRALPELRLGELRGFVTAIPQEEFFVSGTIRENLRLAAPEGTTEEGLWAALERVRARGFVSALPEGLDTVIGEGGLRLSGGEQRRLSVARAFLRPARGVFVFDEPTSGLDPESANAFIDSILGLAARGALVVWSTHRVSEIAAASKVLFFQQGGDPVLATHEELSASFPDYAAFLKAGSSTPKASRPGGLRTP